MLAFEENGPSKLGVRFDNAIPEGVDLGGLCEDDHDFFCSANELRLDNFAGEDMDKLVINALFEIISMLRGGATLLCGSAINGVAMTISMLIIG